MSGLWLFLIIMAILVAAYWLFVPRCSKPVSPDLYRKLLHCAMGDAALAERLIALERQHHPESSRAQLIRYAIERWERDNR